MESGFRTTSRAVLVRAVLVAGIVGNLTISLYLSFALPVFFGIAPLLLFQWDASNIIGPSAYRHGVGAAAMGFFFDFIVSWCWAVFFVVLYVKIPAIARSIVLSGLLFGIMVMLVMIFIVVPLGHAQPASRSPQALLNTLVAHTVFFGLPVALVVKRYLRASSS